MSPVPAETPAYPSPELMKAEAGEPAYEAVVLPCPWCLICAIDPADHATTSRDYGRGFAEALRLVRERLEPLRMTDDCHNGHPFRPGTNTDNDPPDPRWCDECGEARKTKEVAGLVLGHLRTQERLAGR